MLFIRDNYDQWGIKGWFNKTFSARNYNNAANGFDGFIDSAVNFFKSLFGGSKEPRVQTIKTPEFSNFQSTQGWQDSGFANVNQVMPQTNSDPPKKEKLTADNIKKGAKVGKEIGASAEFIDAIDKSLKGNSKILSKFGKVGGYLSAGGQITYNGVEYYKGQISGYRFTFRLGTTITSTVVGAEVGTAIGGPAGFAVGTVIGVRAGVTESAWDTWWPQFKQSFNRFINTATNSWMHYR